jgi:hypothetical protein
MMKPKSEGGLGFKDTHAFNPAMLSKTRVKEGFGRILIRCARVRCKQNITRANHVWKQMRRQLCPTHGEVF